ncbi:MULTISPECIES: S-layer homology domain-containing protein [Citricoccus]|uniref:S-layer homology domain-containing protein n=1 Tax=Citricoccus TaxID=169133 RepID=UPI000255F34F|nr:S-layer homology domain-containing protein [Citricoccus sp. CH26A]
MKNTWWARALSVGAAVALVVAPTIPAADATEVRVPDDGFRACLNDHLGRPADTPVVKTELASIQELECNDHPRARHYRIKDLSGAEYLTGATRISLRHNGISDLTPLAGLTGLQELNLYGNEIAEVSAVLGLTHLRSLDLSLNRITDASALAGMLDQFDEEGLRLYSQDLRFTTEVGEPVVVPPMRDASGQSAVAARCYAWSDSASDCMGRVSTTGGGTRFTPKAPGDHSVILEGTGPDDYSVDARVAVTGTAEPDGVSFWDNPVGSGFYAPVQWMATAGISVGYADGMFKKSKNVTRAQTTQFLYRLTNQSATATKDPFTDVRGGAFRDAVAWFADEGISVGYPDGTFRPNRPVTRAEFAAFLYRLDQPKTFEAPRRSPFTDVNVGGSNWAAITWVDTTGITAGYADGSFKPGKAITRAEVAAFLSRYNQLER